MLPTGSLVVVSRHTPPARTPSGGPPAASRKDAPFSGTASSGGTCPARTSVTIRSIGCTIAYTSVASRPVPSLMWNSLVRPTTTDGGCPSIAYALTALRSWLISAAATTSPPATSPTTRATPPPSSRIASYQSPPSRSSPAPGT